MNKDLCDRIDLEWLLKNFYSKIRVDELLGYIFDDVAKVDWEHHLPIIADFSEGALFNKNTYK